MLKSKKSVVTGVIQHQVYISKKDTTVEPIVTIRTHPPLSQRK